MHVLLFDIDGTLLNAGGSGQAAMEAVLAREFGASGPVVGIPTAGRTDRAITRDLFDYYGLPDHETSRSRFQEAYFAELPQHLSGREGVVLPGVRPLLATLTGRENVTLGLLTGNLARAARVKLEHFELHSYFGFGGYGDEHADRDDVARQARREVCRRLPEVPDERIWVIGDTPSDIRCARAINARVLAVATGIFRSDELSLHQPDVLLEDLSDLAGVLQSLGL